MTSVERMRKLVGMVIRERKSEEKYEKGEQNGDQAMMDEARAAHKELMDTLECMMPEWHMAFRLLSDQMERENNYIDISEPYSDEGLSRLVNVFRYFGIDTFTVSSQWSSVSKAIWAFCQNGCELKGIIEINGQHKAFRSESYEKIPAFVIAVK